MEPRDEIGFQIHTLSHLVNHMVNQMAFANQEVPMTGIHGWIIGYLNDNQGQDIFQKDIQAHFSVRRSTVTAILQLMEKNGLITRRSVSWDARLKKLELTPKAMKMHETVIHGFQQTEQALSSTVTQEEKETFIRLCEKIRAGIEDLALCEKA